MGLIKNAITKVQSINIFQIIAGFFVGIIAFLSGLLMLSEKRRKQANQEIGEKEIENIELKSEKEVRDKSLPDVIARDNEELRARRNKS